MKFGEEQNSYDESVSVPLTETRSYSLLNLYQMFIAKTREMGVREAIRVSINYLNKRMCNPFFVRKPSGIRDKSHGGRVHFVNKNNPLVECVILSEHTINYDSLQSISESNISAHFTLISIDDYRSHKITGIDIKHCSKEDSSLIINKIISKTSCNYVLIISNNVIFVDGVVSKLISIFDNHQDCGMVCGKAVDSKHILVDAGCMMWSNGLIERIGFGSAEFPPDLNTVHAVDVVLPEMILIRKSAFVSLDSNMDIQKAFIRSELAMRTNGFYILFHPDVTYTMVSGNMLKYPFENEKLFFSDYSNIIKMSFDSSECPYLQSKCAKNKETVLIIDDICDISSGLSYEKNRFVVYAPLVTLSGDYEKIIRNASIEILSNFNDHDKALSWIKKNILYFDKVIFNGKSINNDYASMIKMNGNSCIIQSELPLYEILNKN